MVTVNKITAPYIRVECPNKNWYNLNEYEFMDLRIQIAEEKAIGWTCFDYSGNCMEIKSDGTVYPYPRQFDLFDKLLNKLAGWGEPKVEQCVIIRNNVDNDPTIFYTGPISVKDIASEFSAYYSEEKSQAYAEGLIQDWEVYVDNSSNDFYKLERVK